MFTGIVTDIGTIAALERRGGDVRLAVAVGRLDLARVAIGDSIAVNGVCLTAVEVGNGGFAADVSTETLTRTTLGALGVGDPLNLEPALRVGDPLGGHLVSGHVDAVGAVRAIADEGRGQRWWFDAPPEVLRYVAWKGSIAVDGVSLTIADLDAAGFAVALIPHTIEATTFRVRRAGDPVNLEVDTIARYVERLLATGAGVVGR